MKKIASLLMTVALASSVYAGAPAPSYSGKGGKMVNPPAPSCDWFAPGAKLGIFGGGFIPDKGSDSALGGGVLAEYFFTENFGLEGSYGAYATDSTHHEFDLNFIARYPMKNGCWAPYLLLGGGYAVNSENAWNYGVGAGVDLHLTGKIGAFADGAYHWSEHDEGNFTLVRLGLKFRL